MGEREEAQEEAEEEAEEAEEAEEVACRRRQLPAPHPQYRYRNPNTPLGRRARLI